MTKRDASASEALPKLATLLPDIWAFIRRPTLQQERMQWSRTMVLALLGVIVIDLLIDRALHFALASANGVLLEMPQPYENTSSITQQLISLLLLAPLVEETLFRGWLAGQKASLRFAVWGLAGFAVVLTGELAATQDYLTPIIVVGFGLGGIGFAQWLMTYKKDNEVPDWFMRNFHWFVWLGAIFFGISHIGTYEGVSWPVGLVVVIPAIIGGLLLAYSRVRFGLRAAMLHHAIYNAVFLLSAQLSG